MYIGTPFCSPYQTPVWKLNLNWDYKAVDCPETSKTGVYTGTQYPSATSQPNHSLPGGGAGGHNLPLPVPRSPASRTLLSLCLPTPAFIVFFPLSCKSRCLTPCSKRECFGQLASLSKIKNCVVNRTTRHSPTLVSEAASNSCPMMWVTWKGFQFHRK